MIIDDIESGIERIDENVEETLASKSAIEQSAKNLENALVALENDIEVIDKITEKFQENQALLEASERKVEECRNAVEMIAFALDEYVNQHELSEEQISFLKEIGEDVTESEAILHNRKIVIDQCYAKLQEIMERLDMGRPKSGLVKKLGGCIRAFSPPSGKDGRLYKSGNLQSTDPIGGSPRGWGMQNDITPSAPYQCIKSSLEGMKVDYHPLSPVNLERDALEIVAHLGGRDLTRGSCSSLALAYAGNKAGFNVLDFRDGDSREFFSQNSTIAMLCGLPGVDAEVVYGVDDIICADSLLEKIEPGKEYYLATGQHAAIVRSNNGCYEYLELQSAYDNGWHPLHDDKLYSRFGCGKGDQAYPNFLIDIDSLGRNREFIDLLGYINTSENSQYKGESGYAR